MVDGRLGHEVDAQSAVAHALPPVAVLGADAVEACVERHIGERRRPRAEVAAEEVAAVDEPVGDQLPCHVDRALGPAGVDRPGDDVRAVA